jgi:serine/threonine protein kinase
MWEGIIAMGTAGFVWTVDKKTVLKGWEVWDKGTRYAYCEVDCEEDLAREAAIYKRLGANPYILRFDDLEELSPGVHALRVEYAPLSDLRSFLRKCKTKAVSLTKRTRLQLALDAAFGLGYIHDKGVIHCDLSCRNMFVFYGYSVKTGDFGGSIVEGSDEFKMNFFEEPAYQLPSRGREFRNRPLRKRDLFALGSAIYEIMVDTYPHEGLGDDEIEKKFAADEFPSLEGVPASKIIQMCWHEHFESAYQVVEALQVLLRSSEES